LSHSSRPAGRAFGLRVWWWAHSVWWQVAWFWSHSPPQEWLSSPHAFSDHCIVRFSGGLLYDEMFSSVENCSETWSSTQRSEPLSRSMQSPPDPSLPWRNRR
jgi:hypothetical protein